MTPSFPRPESGRRAGIALVIVLGFLALLTIMVVGYAIMMRTERVAARNYQDMVKAKQLVRVGLARAQMQLDADLGGGPPPRSVFPNWVDMSIATTGTALNLSYTAPLLSGDATNFIPLAALTRARQVAANAGWNDIRIKDQNNVDKLIGRTAYLVVDCSGLLDANFAGGVPRGPGLFPSEYVMSNSVLPEMQNAGLPTSRSNTYKRFESLPDLMVCAKVAGHMAAADWPSNLFVYSRSPRGYWDTASRSVVDATYLGGANPDFAAIQAAFVKMGVPDPAALTDNLRDYIDADVRPQNVNSFCTEAVPMINEIIISNSSVSVGSPATNTFTFTPTVELAFPFPGVTNNLNYHLTLGILFAGASPANYNPSNRPASGQYLSTLTFNGPWRGGSSAIFTAAPLVVATSSGVGPVPGGCFAGLRATVVAQLREGGSGGPIVDEVNRLILDMSYVSSTVPSRDRGGAACNDPRYNHLVSNAAEWRPVDSSPGAAGAGTPSADNAGVVTYAAPGGDGTNLMYVRNGPLTNTGELGFLAFNPTGFWQTIRLLRNDTAPAHPVLDLFTVNTNPVAFGLVNPNTLQEPVLAAALTGAWTNFAPLGAGGLGATEARTIAGLIKASGPFTNRSDIGRLDIHHAGWAVTGLADYQREAIIRHTADVLSPRQNMFTVIVVAQAIRETDAAAGVDETTEVVGEQRAVAVVWRDPYPDANGRYEQMVTFFKWLPE